MTKFSIERQPHAILDYKSRSTKARKIETILSGRINLAGARILDIGAGSGFIAEHFINVVGPKGLVEAVDKENQIKTSEISFRIVENTELPFDNSSFDVVISNHVIEHVGENEEQLHHLQEIKRVLDVNGILYLAVPNKWSLIEPHFKLPFLSWLPTTLATRYVRLMNRGDAYDCLLLARSEIISLFGQCGFSGREVTMEALRIMQQQEFSNSVGTILTACPDRLLGLTMPLIPTLIFLGSKK